MQMVWRGKVYLQMSVLFRPHRGLLEEAMKEVVQVSSRDQLVAQLNKIYEIGSRFTIENLNIKPYGYDDRIGWDTYIVTNKGNAVGFTNGYLE